jgi:arylsulfatase A-like enzyme
VIRADRIGTTPGRTNPHLVANIDLAPTIAAVAGVPLPGVDGRSLLPLLEGRPDGWRHALLIEHMRGTNPIPTYCAVRTSRYLYAVYDTGERELYDLAADPYQLRDLSKAAPGLRTRLQGVLDRLCQPPPPGFRRAMGLVASLLAIAGVVALAAAARSRLTRSARVA